MQDRAERKVRDELEDLNGVLRSLQERVSDLLQGTRFARNHSRARVLSQRRRKAQRLLMKALETLEATPESSELKRNLSNVTGRMMGESSESERVGSRHASVRDEHGRLTGNTRAIPIPDLLAFLEVQGKSGELRVDVPDEVITLEFEEGFLIHAFSDNSPSHLRLGEILVAQGALEREDLDDYLNGDSAYLGMIGELLHRGELVSRDQLHSAIDHQIQQLFIRLFRCDEATYEFIAGTPDTSREVVQLNITRLLLESARFHDESKSA